MFDGSKTPDRPIYLHVSGTNFQISVWRARLEIPPARVVSYAQVASAVGNPKAARAVRLAVGANPVALMIPCHRVIQQKRQARRLSLGRDPQTGDTRLGSGEV